jgi:hypothetical protein
MLPAATRFSSVSAGYSCLFSSCLFPFHAVPAVQLHLCISLPAIRMTACPLKTSNQWVSPSASWKVKAAGACSSICPGVVLEVHWVLTPCPLLWHVHINIRHVAEDVHKYLCNQSLSWTVMTVLWYDAPCSLVEIDRHFSCAYCLHHQGYYGGTKCFWNIRQFMKKTRRSRRFRVTQLLPSPGLRWRQQRRPFSTRQPVQRNVPEDIFILAAEIWALSESFREWYVFISCLCPH